AELPLVVDEQRVRVAGAVRLGLPVGAADPVAGNRGREPLAVREEVEAVVVGVIVPEVDEASGPVVALREPLEVSVAAEDAGLQRDQAALILPRGAREPEGEVGRE